MQRISEKIEHPGRVDSGKDKGRKLLAHELTHIVQQNNTIHAKKNPKGKAALPPTEKEIFEKWLTQWAEWKRQGLTKIDCGTAARTVAKALGGVERAKVVFRGKPSRKTCTKQECKDAMSRSDEKHWDYITETTPGIVVVHDGVPGVNLTARKYYPIFPGMLIYTSECCGKGEWICHHMMMYYTEGKILDSIYLKKPKPRKFGRSYRIENSKFVVILEVLDPFAEIRGTIDKKIMDAIFWSLSFIL